MALWETVMTAENERWLLPAFGALLVLGAILGLLGRALSRGAA